MFANLGHFSPLSIKVTFQSVVLTDSDALND